MSTSITRKVKNVIKVIDRKFLGKSIARVRNRAERVYYYLSSYLKTPRISPMRKETFQNFGFKSRYTFFQAAQYYLQVNRIDGVYFEFGCHQANTFRMALNTIGSYNKPNKIYKFYAFDSFEGMPEPEGIDRQKIWRGGMNFTSKEEFKKLVSRDLHRVEIVQGFYQQSLSNFNFDKSKKIALCYLDCDYYSSTKECLNFLKDKLHHGTLLAFDDWNCYYSDPLRGQKKAFGEFREEVKKTLIFIQFFEINSGGICFIVHELDKLGKEVL